EAKKNHSKSFNLIMTYTSLADYLAVDRSAMMRELKNLKEDKLIKDVNKKITLLYE
ncbi:MAG: winged helix-turn-helix domain-containing protein, partial [Bacilli bacterium]|nr:winged helix-turn-helix domain-containing protein [Bacilli bacterium]